MISLFYLRALLELIIYYVLINLQFNYGCVLSSLLPVLLPFRLTDICGDSIEHHSGFQCHLRAHINNMCYELLNCKVCGRFKKKFLYMKSILKKKEKEERRISYRMSLMLKRGTEIRAAVPCHKWKHTCNETNIYVFCWNRNEGAVPKSVLY